MQISERKKVGMVLPPPIIFGLAAVAGVILHRLAGGAFTFSGVRSLTGGIVIAFSILLVGASVRLFRRAGTPVRPVSPATTIVKSGPYRYSRNPMYVGMAGVLTGLAILLGSPAVFLMLIGALIAVHFGVVLPEERYLEALYGETYLHYKRSVSRWL